jgi:hypothetical protein
MSPLSTLSQQELQARVNQIVNLFTAQSYHQVVQMLEEFVAADLFFSGLHYLRAASFIHLGEYHRVLPALEAELANPQCSTEATTLYQQISFQAETNPTLKNLRLDSGKYVICGLPPGNTGTGRFLESLLPAAISSGFQPVHPNPDKSFSSAEQLLVSSIRNANILLMHPQTLGFSTFRALCSNGNTVSMYVLDNSFFCLRSYNHRPGIGHRECLDCLSNVRNCHESCQPHPPSVSREQNLAFLEWLQSYSKDIHFFCQTKGQAKLLVKHFGPGTRHTVIGMRTEELSLIPNSRPFDLVFHGEGLAAKGVSFVLALAKRLPEFSILVPSEAPLVLSQAQHDPNFDGSIPSNVTVTNMRWDSGLEAHVRACRLVLCPSQWSAPVEGALLKSLFFNGNVAVTESSFAFEKELPSDTVLRLPSDVIAAGDMVRSFLTSGRCNREIARRWVLEYERKVDLSRIFSIATDPLPHRTTT